jgi:RNA polymerase sigma-70 factor, ECF subfamily
MGSGLFWVRNWLPGAGAKARVSRWGSFGPVEAVPLFQGSFAREFPSGAEAPVYLASFTAWLKPCPFKIFQALALAGGTGGVGIFWLGMARRADDPKYSGKKTSETAAGAGAEAGSARSGGKGYGANSDPEDEGLAQHSDEDGVGEDMATLVLDKSGLRSGLGSGVGPVSGQGARTAAGAQGPVNYAADESSDAAVMLRVAAGDEAGFNYLIGKYHRAMISFLFRMVHNQAVAEELAQEVFLRVYRSRESYRAEAKFTTWLYRIATNLAVNHARDTKHERSVQNVYLDAPDEETGTTPDVADDTPTIEQTMLRKERMAAIRAHVMELPERQRMAVLMHKYQGMDYRQIGEVLKLSESATKSLLFRAYQTLREKLKDFV